MAGQHNGLTCTPKIRKPAVLPAGCVAALPAVTSARCAGDCLRPGLTWVAQLGGAGRRKRKMYKYETSLMWPKVRAHTHSSARIAICGLHTSFAIAPPLRFRITAGVQVRAIGATERTRHRPPHVSTSPQSPLQPRECPSTGVMPCRKPSLPPAASGARVAAGGGWAAQRAPSTALMSS